MIIHGLVHLITTRVGKGVHFIAFHLTLNGIYITRSLKQCFKIGNMQPEKDPYWSGQMFCSNKCNKHSHMQKLNHTSIAQRMNSNWAQIITSKL